MVLRIWETYSPAQMESIRKQGARCGDLLMKSILTWSRTTRAVSNIQSASQTQLTIIAALESQYQCLYGIASSSSGLPAGEIDIGYDEKRSTLIIVGKDDRTYYFVFEKLDKIYKPPDIPRYTEADKMKFVERHGNMKVTDRVLLQDLHKHSVSSTLVGIETAAYKVDPRFSR
jgi:hypothetical protein